MSRWIFPEAARQLINHKELLGFLVTRQIPTKPGGECTEVGADVINNRGAHFSAPAFIKDV